jgi:RNA polymerase sigma factor (sigma-70 family)
VGPISSGPYVSMADVLGMVIGRRALRDAAVDFILQHFGRLRDRLDMRGVEVPLDGPGAIPWHASIEGLFHREYGDMFRLAVALLGGDADADEVVQEAFVVVNHRWGSLDTPGAYLRMTVINGARKRLRDLRNRQAAVEKLSTLSTQVASGPRPYLSDVLDGLPERERTAVVLRYYAGLNASEIGELFGCPAGTVRSLLHRALRELERVLE